MARHPLLRSFALAALLFGAVWVAVIAYWSMSNHAPSAADAILYLIALPVLLLSALILIRLGVNAAKRRRVEANGDASQTEGSPGQETAATVQTIAILAADVMFAGGDSTAALAETAKAKPPASLHPLLRDSRGMPIFAAAIEGPDPAAVEASLPDTAHAWQDSYKRTLWLTETLALRVLETHFEALRAALPTPTQAPLLQIEWLPPMRWSDADRGIALGWLADRLAAHGWSKPHFQLHGRRGGESASVLQRLNELNSACNANGSMPPHLLLASDSFVDETSIANWEAQGLLYSAGQPEGLLPGEGAAAVILAAHGTHGLAELARLGEVFLAERDKPVDTPQRLQADTLRELTTRALTASGLAADAPALLVSDTDLRASRNGEALRLAEQALPDRDPVDAVLPLGAGNGECGASLALALVAVAAQLTGDSQLPHLIVSHGDSRMRGVAAVARPAAEPATPSPSLA